MHANTKRGRKNASHEDEKENRQRPMDVEDDTEQSEEYLRKQDRIRK